MTTTKATATAVRTASMWCLTALIADQVTKIWARTALDACPGAPIDDCERLAILGPIGFLRMQNRGGAFGVQQGLDVWIVASCIALLVGLSLLALRPSRRVGSSTGLLIGGVVGNAIDRLAWGSVTDFIDPGDIVIFNVADVALLIGAVGGSLALFASAQAPKNSSSTRQLG